MNILLIGSGGREHALAWKIARSPLLNQLHISPGNGGTSSLGQHHTLNESNHQEVIHFCHKNNIDLVVIGPEAPLVAGLGDDLRQAGIDVFGPSKAAAQLEGSKHFTKALCDLKNIPTATYGHFTNLEEAIAYVQKQGAPIVIKADGLAAGKGVSVAMTLDEAYAALNDCFDGSFGKAGAAVVVEEFLQGEEASQFFLCDGKTALPFGTAQDHKRVGEGDTGPNTGGMGAYSPAPVLTPRLQEQVLQDIIMPTLEGMAEAGTPFRGVLYAGLMITEKGPHLIEYNVRFGDPECQVLMMRFESDIVPLLQACAKGSLSSMQAQWSDDVALTVVMAAKGYPAAYEKGSEIHTIPNNEEARSMVFHAGTQRDKGKIIATGGRVLNITATGQTTKQAQEKAYHMLDKITWPQGFARRDIGWRAIEREK